MKNQNEPYFIYIKPDGLKRSKHSHPWHIGYIFEGPSSRTDNNWYYAFVFRNDDRTIYGIKEWMGPHFDQKPNHGKIAARIINDKEYRDNLITDDPDVKNIWKRR